MADIIDLLKKVRKIEIVASKTVNEFFAGQYKSVFRGRGMEFNEVREYEPGDDIRSIDWNVTARASHPYIKRYVEERELTVLFLVDLSASGVFGTRRSKSDTAIEAAATLMFSALKSNDKVGLLTFGEGIRNYYQPRKGRGNVLRLIRELLACAPTAGATNLCEAVEYVGRVLKRRAVIFILSDFLVSDLLEEENDMERIPADFHPKSQAFFSGDPSVYGLFGGPRRSPKGPRRLTPTLRALSVAARRHDLVAMILHDRRERDMPDLGLVRLRDAETGDTQMIDTSNPQVRQWIASHHDVLRARVADSLRRCGVDQLNIETEGDFVRTLRIFFEKRTRSV